MATPLTFDTLARDVVRKAFFKRLGLVLTILTAAVIVSLLVVLLVSIRSTQLGGTPIGHRLLKSSDLIVSCTTPEGKCYQASAKSQASAVGQINEITIYVQACGNQHPDANVTELQKCVRALYMDAHKP